MAVCHESSTSMFTSRPSPTSFNFPPFGYPTQGNGYGQEYSQYPTMPEAPYQQPPWAGMYGAAPRPVHSGLEEWTPNYMVPQMQQAYNYTYRAPISSSSMGLDYSINGSPPPTSSSGDDSPNGSGSSISKTLRAPYDWMKSASMNQVPVNGKTRTKDKYRNVYTDHQRLELEKEFHYSKFITIRRKTELSAKLNLSERQVKIWFQNRRAKERKQNKKEKKGECNVVLDLEDSLSPPTIDSNNHINNSHSSNSDQENMPPQYHQHHQHQQPQYPNSISPHSRDNLSPPSAIPVSMYKNVHSQHLPQAKPELTSMDLNNFYTRYMPYAS